MLFFGLHLMLLTLNIPKHYSNHEGPYAGIWFSGFRAQDLDLGFWCSTGWVDSGRRVRRIRVVLGPFCG